jgi:hypothetical protein
MTSSNNLAAMFFDVIALPYGELAPAGDGRSDAARASNRRSA